MEDSPLGPWAGNVHNEDAELVFFDLLANTFVIAESYRIEYEHTKNELALELLQKKKAKFYTQLSAFEKSGYVPKEKIQPDAIAKVHDFESLDWTVNAEFEKVREYLNSLRSS